MSPSADDADSAADRRRMLDRSSEDLQKTASVLTELAAAQARLIGELRDAVAALPDTDVVAEFREATERLTVEIQHGQDRLRNLVLAEGIAFLILVVVVVSALSR